MVLYEFWLNFSFFCFIFCFTYVCFTLRYSLKAMTSLKEIVWPWKGADVTPQAKSPLHTLASHGILTICVPPDRAFPVTGLIPFRFVTIWLTLHSAVVTYFTSHLTDRSRSLAASFLLTRLYYTEPPSPRLYASRFPSPSRSLLLTCFLWLVVLSAVTVPQFTQFTQFYCAVEYLYK